MRSLKAGTFLSVLAAVMTGCASQAPVAPAAKPMSAATREAPSDAGEAQHAVTLTEASTLSDYLAYAALNNPGLEAAFHRWQAALARVPQVESLPDPRFTYQYFIRRVETRVGAQRHLFGLAQTFPGFGKRALRGDMAAEAAHAARRRYDAQKFRLFYRVKDAYYECTYLGRAIAIMRENFKLVQYFEIVARTRYKTAAATHPDVIRAQVELGKLENQLQSLEALRGPLMARLNAAMNRPIDAPLPWPDSALQETIEATDAEIFGWLHEANPELGALEHDIARERYALELAGREVYPDVTLGLNYIDVGGARMDTPGDGKDVIAATFSINLPVWAEKYRAAEREANRRHKAAIGARMDRENRLAGEASLVLYNLRDAERKVRLFRDTLRPKARQSLRATEASFRAGKATFLDLVDAQRVLLEFELSYERSRATAAQRLAELESLVGRSIPRAGEAVKAATRPQRNQ